MHIQSKFDNLSTGVCGGNVVPVLKSCLSFHKALKIALRYRDHPMSSLCLFSSTLGLSRFANQSASEGTSESLWNSPRVRDRPSTETLFSPAGISPMLSNYHAPPNVERAFDNLLSKPLRSLR